MPMLATGQQEVNRKHHLQVRIAHKL